MARVAQYPAYQAGSRRCQWRRIGVRIGSAAAVLFLLFSFVGWVIIAERLRPRGRRVPAQVPGGFHLGDEQRAQGRTFSIFPSQPGGRRRFRCWEIGFKSPAGTVFFEIIDFFRGQNGLAVQLALLLLTVGFNYWVTRLVLSYQRRSMRSGPTGSVKAPALRAG